jgi:hypothetical protein
VEPVERDPAFEVGLAFPGERPVRVEPELEERPPDLDPAPAMGSMEVEPLEARPWNPAAGRAYGLSITTVRSLAELSRTIPPLLSYRRKESSAIRGKLSGRCRVPAEMVPRGIPEKPCDPRGFAEDPVAPEDGVRA